MSLAVTTDTVETARVRHDLWPVATAALGRAMTGAILLAGDFKNHENVSLRIKGDGPLGVVHVDAFSDNTVRGYVDEPHVDVPLKHAGKLDVGSAVEVIMGKYKLHDLHNWRKTILLQARFKVVK